MRKDAVVGRAQQMAWRKSKADMYVCYGKDRGRCRGVRAGIGKLGPAAHT